MDLATASAAATGGDPTHASRARGQARLDFVARHSSRCRGGRVDTGEEWIMVDISRVALFGKLNAPAYQAIESATVFCKLRGNPYVELAHWFHQVLQRPDGSDLHAIARGFELNPAKVAQELTEALDRLPRG